MNYVFNFNSGMMEINIPDMIARYVGESYFVYIKYPSHDSAQADRLFKELGLSRNEHPFRGTGTMPRNEFFMEQWRTLIEAYENSAYSAKSLLNSEEIARIKQLNS